MFRECGLNNIEMMQMICAPNLERICFAENQLINLSALNKIKCAKLTTLILVSNYVKISLPRNLVFQTRKMSCILLEVQRGDLIQMEDISNILKLSIKNLNSFGYCSRLIS